MIRPPCGNHSCDAFIQALVSRECVIEEGRINILLRLARSPQASNTCIGRSSPYAVIELIPTFPQSVDQLGTLDDECLTFEMQRWGGGVHGAAAQQGAGKRACEV